MQWPRFIKKEVEVQTSQVISVRGSTSTNPSLSGHESRPVPGDPWVCEPRALYAQDPALGVKDRPACRSASWPGGGVGRVRASLLQADSVHCRERPAPSVRWFPSVVVADNVRWRVWAPGVPAIGSAVNLSLSPHPGIHAPQRTGGWGAGATPDSSRCSCRRPRGSLECGAVVWGGALPRTAGSGHLFSWTGGRSQAQRGKA